MRNAFLVYFPKPPVLPAFNQGNYSLQVPTDDRPVLIIATDIGDVATKNRSAIHIEQVNCRDVLIDERIKESFCPMQEKKP